jgi:hypothetical protein
MLYTNATNLTTNSSENVFSRKKLYAKEFVVKFVAFVCTISVDKHYDNSRRLYVECLDCLRAPEIASTQSFSLQ